MAITQISRVTNRKGLQENLPQLAGAQFGWSVDQRRLFIGNGTLEEGAPVIGNTEILTEYSDILSFTTGYTYQGQAAGYVVETGPSASAPVSMSLQNWNDQFASVKSFGATGDGVTDDTDAINRALYQLYCREVNPQIRRRLFFPAGVYRITSSLLIPPYAYLYGEGRESSVFVFDPDDSTIGGPAAITTDSLQQSGANLGLGGAVMPTMVVLRDLGIQSQAVSVDVFEIESLSGGLFDNVAFVGPLLESDLTSTGDAVAAVRITSTPSFPAGDLVFSNAKFSGMTYGIYSDDQVESVTVDSGIFDTLYQGAALATGIVTGSGPQGFRFVGNLFDNIYAQGLYLGSTQLNISANNLYLDVGNHFQGIASPETSVVTFEDNNNASVSDLFERDDTAAAQWPRVDLQNTTGVVYGNNGLTMGSYVRESGETQTLLDNTGATALYTVDTDLVRAFAMDYTIVRGTTTRTGRMLVSGRAQDSLGDVQYSDDYVENADTGVTLSVSQSVDVITVLYATDASGSAGTITYSLSHLA